jgi:hypothetical protein
MGNHSPQMGTLFVKTIDTMFISSKIQSNMFRDKTSILMEAKSKRKPSSATSVVGFGLVLVKQEKDKESLS